MTPSADGRYKWTVSAFSPNGSPISFVGDPAMLTGTLALTWSVLQQSTDGSMPTISYSTDGGATFTAVSVSSANSPQGATKTSGEISASLSGATGIIVNTSAVGGTPNANAPSWIIAVGITRNATETLAWDTPDPFDPVNYNAQRMDFNGFPSATLSELRRRVMVRLGFSNQAANPPPGMAALINDFLFDSQSQLYRKYPALHTRRFFRWKMLPGQRFYSIKDNDDDPLSSFHLDPLKKIEWAGIQDTRNVWYPLLRGIPPELYTMIDKTWRPARYDVRQAIEVYPAPDQVYFLWMRAHFGLLSFTQDSDATTIDSNLVFLHALACAKAHYGQADANNVMAMANAYRGELIAGTHLTGHYIPNTKATPPAIRPTMIQYSDTPG